METATSFVCVVLICMVIRKLKTAVSIYVLQAPHLSVLVSVIVEGFRSDLSKRNESVTLQVEDRLMMERLNRLEIKVRKDEALIQEAKRELEFLKNMKVIRRWRRGSKKVTA